MGAHQKQPLIEALESRKLFSTTATTVAPLVIHETAGKKFTADLGLASPFSVPVEPAAKANAKTAVVSTPITFVFNAIIHWGDGKTSAGTAVANANGTYDIDGTHTYAASGHYHIVVYITRLPSGPGPIPEFIELYQPIHDTAVVSAATST